MAQSVQAGEAPLELLSPGPRRQPEFECGVDEIDDLALVEHATGKVDLGLPGPELAGCKRRVVVLADQIEDLAA